MVHMRYAGNLNVYKKTIKVLKYIAPKMLILPTRATTKTPRKTLSALQRMCMKTMETSVMARLDSLCLCLFCFPLRI